MFLNKNDEGKVDLNLYDPKIETTRSFKITIEEVVRTETEEMEGKYINSETGEIISSYDYEYKDEYKEKQEEFKKVNLPTGERSVNEKSTKIYEQEKSDIDISDIAMYINRSK